MASVRVISGVCVALVLGLSGSGVRAGTLYYTSINEGDATFARYDREFDRWRALDPYDTQTQMAATADGHLYAYDSERDVIQRYRPEIDAWIDHGPGPGVSNAWGNLEVTPSGRFLYTRFNGDRLYHTDANGDWSSVALPFVTAAFGDYDPRSDRYIVGEFSTGRIHAIDLESFEITSYASGGGASELRRMGEILGESFYENSSSGGFRVWDLSEPEERPDRIGQPLGTSWMAAAADDAAGILYAVDLLSGAFYALGGNGFTTLAAAPAVSNHSSLVYVPHNPEPSTAVLLFLGLIGLTLSGRRERHAGRAA